MSGSKVQTSPLAPENKHFEFAVQLFSLFENLIVNTEPEESAHSANCGSSENRKFRTADIGACASGKRNIILPSFVFINDILPRS